VTLLQPKNEEQIIAKLAELPEEKRRVVILVGKHPGEGSTQAAKKLHRAWEKLGATAVKIPESMTPHGFWRMALNVFKRSPREARKLADMLPPSDYELTEKISSTFGVPVISLHGTPHSGKSQFMTFSVSPSTVVDTELLDLLGLTGKRVKLKTEDRHHSHAVVVEHFFPAIFSVSQRKATETAYSVLLSHYLEQQVENKSKANPLIRKRYEQLAADYLVRQPKKIPGLPPAFEAALNGLIKVLAAQQSEGEFKRKK